MSPFQFQTVPNIIAGLGSIQQLKALLTEQNNQRVLLVTDPGMVQLQLHAPVLETLEAAECDYRIYASVQADPPEHIVLEAAEFARQNQIDTVIGFGGGSSLDVAKIIALLAHPEQKQQLHEMYGINQAQKPRLPLILIPTTACTGSAVTPTSICTTGKPTKTVLATHAL